MEGRKGGETESLSKDTERKGERELGSEGQMSELSFSWLVPGDKSTGLGVERTGNSLPTLFPTSHH